MMSPIVRYVLYVAHFAFQFLEQWQVIHRRQVVLQGNWGLVAGNCHHLVNLSHHKGKERNKVRANKYEPVSNYVIYKVLVLLSNLAAVRSRSQEAYEAYSGPQSSSSQLPPPGESSLLQRKRKEQDTNEVPQQKKKHSQEIHTSSRELRSGSRQLLPSGKSSPPQKKGKKQGANKMPRQKKQYST